MTLGLTRTPLCGAGNLARSLRGCPTRPSNPHGHYHVAVMIFGSVGDRTQFAGALLILQLEGYLLLTGGAQKIEQILGVESDLHVRARIFAGHTLFAFAGLDRRRKNLDLTRCKLHANRSEEHTSEL